jgi:hypothetical protein
MGKTIAVLEVKNPKIRSRVMPKPTQYHTDRKKNNKKYACRNKGRKNNREDW